MQLPQMRQRLQQRRPRTPSFRGSPAEKPGTQHGQDQMNPPEQAIGAIERKANPRLLSGRFYRTACEHLAQEIPRPSCAETETEQPVARAQTPRFAATAFLWTAPDSPGADAPYAPVIQMTVNEAMPDERSACPAGRTAHCGEPFEESLNLPPAFKETLHPRSIRKRGPMTDKEKREKAAPAGGAFSQIERAYPAVANWSEYGTIYDQPVGNNSGLQSRPYWRYPEKYLSRAG